jgi:hypothetical protein
MKECIFRVEIMKIYTLTIMYDEQTDVVEFIQESIEEESELPHPIIPPVEDYTPVDELTDEVKLVMLKLALDEDGGIGFA